MSIQKVLSLGGVWCACVMGPAAKLPVLRMPCFVGVLTTDESVKHRQQPIQIGSEKQLFIDELFFDRKVGVRLVVNQPVKDATPVLRADPDRPWELNRISSGNSVVDDGREIRIYYDAIAPCPSDNRSRWLCMAVSKDGIHFDKPRLGVVPFGDRNDTNIVWPPRHVASHEPGNVFLDTNPRCPPDERHKLVYCYGHEGIYMAVSGDGLRFRSLEKPSFRPSDTTNAAFFDERLGRYVGWVRVWDQARRVGRCEFDDLRDWGPATTVFGPDDEDRNLDSALFRGMDFYDGGVNVYRGAPGIYVGFPAAYYHFHQAVAQRRGRGGTRSPGNDGNIEAQLITSRDGVHWYRPERGKPFLPRGPDGSWDYGMTYVSGGSNLVYRDDEIWIYYSAQPFTHGDYALSEKEALGSVMRAVLRRDGFVSVDAGSELGEFNPPAVKREVTPILAVGDLLGFQDTGGVLDLVVESLPGPAPRPGLITPDFWSMGLVAFPADNGSNFVATMHSAFRDGLLQDRHVRLRWRLVPKWGEYPRAMRGTSAEVAAACCVRALMNQGPQLCGPLLDCKVAITACLGPDAETFDDRPLKPVEPTTIDAKFQAAVSAGLITVLVCTGQVPAETQSHQDTNKVDGKSTGRSVWIEPVATLGDAYDSLLIASAGICRYKESVYKEWSGKWIESETPQWARGREFEVPDPSRR